jgi:hypothetical protein
MGQERGAGAGVRSWGLRERDLGEPSAEAGGGKPYVQRFQLSDAALISNQWGAAI